MGKKELTLLENNAMDAARDNSLSSWQVAPLVNGIVKMGVSGCGQVMDALMLNERARHEIAQYLCDEHRLANERNNELTRKALDNLGNISDDLRAILRHEDLTPEMFRMVMDELHRCAEDVHDIVEENRRHEIAINNQFLEMSREQNRMAEVHHDSLMGDILRGAAAVTVGALASRAIGSFLDSLDDRLNL